VWGALILTGLPPFAGIGVILLLLGGFGPSLVAVALAYGRVRVGRHPWEYLEPGGGLHTTLATPATPRDRDEPPRRVGRVRQARVGPGSSPAVRERRDPRHGGDQAMNEEQNREHPVNIASPPFTFSRGQMNRVHPTMWQLRSQWRKPGSMAGELF
jgi:hypothetical protein